MKGKMKMKRFSPTSMDQHFKATMKEDPQGAYVLHSDFEKVVGALKDTRKSLLYYSKEQFDRVCFLDHATCEETYGQDARNHLVKIDQTLKELGVE